MHNSVAFVSHPCYASQIFFNLRRRTQKHSSPPLSRSSYDTRYWYIMVALALDKTAKKKADGRNNVATAASADSTLKPKPSIGKKQAATPAKAKKDAAKAESIIEQIKEEAVKTTAAAAAAASNQEKTPSSKTIGPVVKANKASSKKNKGKATVATGGEEGEAASCGGTGKKVKKQKRISKPSSYSMFSQDQTEVIKAKFPEYDFGERSREVAKRWASLSENEKQKYQAIADERWEKKLSELKQQGRDINNLNGHPKKKRFPNAYTIFLRDNHAIVKGEHSDWSFQEISQEIARRWKESSEEEKNKYVDIVAGIKAEAAEAAKEDEEAAANKEEVIMTDAKEEETVPEKVKEDVEMTDAAADEKHSTEHHHASSAKKKKITAYNIFCTETRPELESKFPDKGHKEIADDLRKAWKGMDREHKAPYEAKAASVNSEK